MATYTMELSEVLEHLYGSTMDPDDYNIDHASFTFNGVTYGELPVLPDPSAIGLHAYPIFHENYRPILNGKIIDEYFKREIGVETIDLFRNTLKRKMDQIMPYYNQLYASQMLEFDPLSTMDIRSVGSSKLNGKETSNATNETESGNESKARAVSSETPQTMLAGNEDYATGASDTSSKSDVKSTSKQDGESNTENSTNSENRVTGYQGNVSELLMRYRMSLINIDTMILAELEDCFFQVFQSGDSYSQIALGWYY